MCVRLNNVHILRKHLSFFVETAEKNVLNISGKYSEDFGQIDVSNPPSNEASTSQAYGRFSLPIFLQRLSQRTSTTMIVDWNPVTGSVSRYIF